MSYKIDNIRNFAIIAHIDHGKSTLADQLIRRCQGLTERELEDRVLDSMELEKEKGITIKSQTARLVYRAKDGEEYILNLMDTPGHVDFAYEVSRCLAACEGSVLLVDSSQGVEAQTLANVYKAIENNHEIIVALNKVDLPASHPEEVKEEIQDVIGISAEDAVLVSAKHGTGVDELLENIVTNLPAPKGNKDDRLLASLVDSWYDTYLGVIVLVRIIDGTLNIGDSIRMMSTDAIYKIETLGVFTPKKKNKDMLQAGEVGFIIANIKHVGDCKIGDTIVMANDRQTMQLPGFKQIQPVVFCGMYTSDNCDFPILKSSLEKLHLNDSSFTYESETSAALGFGFRCGFLGLLHLEIIKERLEREFDLDLVATSPSVIYRVLLRSGEEIEIHNPIDLPDPSQIESIREPWVKASIVVNEEYVGSILDLCRERRGEQLSMHYVNRRINLVYSLPLNEIVYDFYDNLKSYSRGYASMDWEFDEYRDGDLIKLSILINSEEIDALSSIVHRSHAESRGRKYCERLKDLIPRQMFPIPIQGAIFGKIIARETVSALRKDVLAKCYGGDISRKKKLLEKQKRGKKRMKMFGNVEVPNNIYIEVLKSGEKK